MKDFLFELGTEELPPKALKSFIKSLRDSVDQGRISAGLTRRGEILVFGSPRRLAVIIENLAERHKSGGTLEQGPPLKIAFDASGNPTPAAFAFAKKHNVSIEQLSKTATHLSFEKQNPDVLAVDVMPNIIKKALNELPIPKRMRWGARKAEFVRPVHWLVMMYGADVIDCEILEQKADNQTRGHRFHSPDFFTITSPADYQNQLRDHKVEVCFAERRKNIVAQANRAADKLGGKAVIDPDLLDEVTALVEWPVALAGNFEKRFLEVPQEALISSMSEHQKYFHVVDANGKLMPHFITVANLESKDPKQVIAGNERVIRPRLTDAAFFFETDKKQTLESRLEKLKSVTFQEKLGSVYDKSVRISLLARYIALKMGLPVLTADSAARAGLLCKTDLVTKMVLEFDQMQGIAGFYYAINDNETAWVAHAIRDHYLPRSAFDAIPSRPLDITVALADRLDTLVGIFSVGERPTGSKDPFALRRAAIAVLNIILQQKLDLHLRDLLTKAGEPLNCPNISSVAEYIIERLAFIYQDQGVPIEVFNAVAAKNLDNPLDINMRVVAVNEFNKLPEAQGLAAANKRVANILAKSGAEKSISVNNTLFQQDEERALAKLVTEKRSAISPLLDQRKYTEALCLLADMRPAVDAFFDKVMVNAEDKNLRANRHALLGELSELFLNIADISHLVPDNK
jgi:glycyl-tRNA synthetase beta chain